jgi:hypothetical protein
VVDVDPVALDRAQATNAAYYATRAASGGSPDPDDLAERIVRKLVEAAPLIYAKITGG